MSELLTAIGIGGAAMGGVLIAGGLMVGSSYNAMAVQANAIGGQGQAYRNLVDQRTTILNRITKLAREAGMTERKAMTEIIAQRKVAKDAKQLWQWVKEAYPKLESIAGFKDVRDEVNRVEENITQLKQEIAEEIFDYNNLVVVFPRNLIAKAFGFEKLDFRTVTSNEATPTFADEAKLKKDFEAFEPQQNDGEAVPSKSRK